jgi:hypothetical protein
MERLFNRFKEIRQQWRPGYVHELEEQASRVMSGLTYGVKDEKLLDAGDMGLIVYHYGSNKRVLPRFPYIPKIFTGKEYVFLEYQHAKGLYHFVGSVDDSKRFTLLKLERYQDGNGGYRRVSMSKHQEVIRSVLETLQKN